jgi:hypothetical protein
LPVGATTSADMGTATDNIPQMPTAGFPLNGAMTTPPVSGLEPYVDAQVVAEFLSVRRAEVLKLTREGKIRGYAYRGQQRHVYRYRLSEVSADFAALLTPFRGTISAAAPVSQRRKSNG